MSVKNVAIETIEKNCVNLEVEKFAGLEYP